MALVTCPECAAKISDKALACPSCGYPLAQKGRSAWPSVILALFADQGETLLAPAQPISPKPEWAHLRSLGRYLDIGSHATHWAERKKTN